MALTRRRRRLALAIAAVVLLIFAARWVDVRVIAGDIKGDEATYILMASSLAEDGDLRYARSDYTRFVRFYGHGPEGIFLKKSYTLGLRDKRPVPTTEYLSYGKALIYPLAAAPFVWLGGLGGMLLFNWMLLVLCMWLGARFTAAVTRSRKGAAIAVVFVIASVVPVFAAWLTSEIFNFALVFVAYYLWLYKRVAPDEKSWLTRGELSTVLAALLIGVATFSKATNAALACPMLLEALVNRRWRVLPTVGLAFIVGVYGLFGLNALITGEANYQGATEPKGRQSFYNGAFPFDDKNTAFASGNEMVTNDADTERVLSADVLSQTPMNVLYFFFGRHAGLVPFYFPGVVITLVWLLGAHRAPIWQWGTFIATSGSVAALILLFPDSWNGGGGPPGNRYFLSLYPPMLFLTTAAVGRTILAVSALVGLCFVGPMVARPFAASSATWKNVEKAPLRYLPIELTLLNDLPCRTNLRRCPIKFLDDPPAQFYLFDGGAYFPEGNGLWISGPTTTDFVVKTDLQIRKVELELSSPVANEVTGSFAGRPISASLRPGQPATVRITRLRQSRYHQNFVYVVHLSTTNGFFPTDFEPASKDTRRLGVFLKLSLTYEPPAVDPAAAPEPTPERSSQ